jgi:hypothetical protein
MTKSHSRQLPTYSFALEIAVQVQGLIVLNRQDAQDCRHVSGSMSFRHVHVYAENSSAAVCGLMA